MKNILLWAVTGVAVVSIDVSEENVVSIIRMKRISELDTTLEVTSN
jgi:hypothetical protein